MRGPKHPWVKMMLSSGFFQFLGELLNPWSLWISASILWQRSQEQLLQQQLVLLQSSPRFGVQKKTNFKKRLEVTNSLENSNKIIVHLTCCCCVVFISNFVCQWIWYVKLLEPPWFHKKHNGNGSRHWLQLGYVDTRWLKHLWQLWHHFPNQQETIWFLLSFFLGGWRLRPPKSRSWATLPGKSLFIFVYLWFETSLRCA